MSGTHAPTKSLQSVMIWENAMEFVPFVQVAKLEAIFTMAGQRVENVHHYWFESAPTQTDLEDLAVFYKTWWDTGMKPLAPSEVSLQLIKVTDLTIEDGNGIEYGSGLPIQGTNLPNMCPGNVTLAIKWTTGRTGRSYRGRTYHVGVREDNLSANSFNSAHAQGLLDVYTNLVVADLPNNDAVMVIASRVHNGVPRTVGLATPVTNVSIDLTVDSQRRRLPGRGK